MDCLWRIDAMGSPSCKLYPNLWEGRLSKVFDHELTMRSNGKEGTMAEESKHLVGRELRTPRVAAIAGYMKIKRWF